MGYSIVIGYSVTGAIFLKNPETNEYLVLYPSMPGNNCKQYGSFESNKEFEEKILKNEDFPHYGLYPINPEDLEVLEKRLGSCRKEEIYYPVPEPMLGGSGKLETFDKGNIWVHTDIIGQSKGL